MPQAAYLIIHLIAYGGSIQSAHAFRYASMKECAAALPQMQMRFTKDGNTVLAQPMVCTDRKPQWWQG